MKVLDFKPDIIQANDWQSGLVPVYLKTVYKQETFYKNTKCVFSIHNLSYQGIFPVELFSFTSLDWKYFTVNGLEYYGHLNLMKGGIVFSDVIATVSETYAGEIQTPEFGSGLEGVIRDKAVQNNLYGIVNGVDYQDWDPKTDAFLYQKYQINYDYENIGKKKEIKKAFISEHITPNPDLSIPLISIVSRLVDQKGFDLIFEIMDELLKLGVYFTVLGTGKNEYEKKLRAIHDKYPQKTAVFTRFDIPLSHHIEAASDIFIMPSRFEPCGLNQLYSIKYGTIPVARNTGGLADTIKNGKTGFLFADYDPDDFLNTLKKAIHVYKHENAKWLEMIETGMKEDWSWEKAAEKYLEIYKKLISK
jgi:starch synthase